MEQAIISPFSKRIIVGGPPRTGSTLLRFILDCSDDIISGPETSFFLLPLSEHQRRVNRYACPKSAKLEIPKEEIVAAILSARTSVQAFDGIMTAFQARIGVQKKGWAEKSPRNCYHYPRQAAEDETLLFLSVVRNGLDIVTSKKPGHPTRADEYWCSVQRYVDSMRCVYAFDNPRHHIVHYEELVREPERFIGKLGDFLGVALDRHALDRLKKPAKSRDTSKVVQSKLEGTFQIEKTWVDRWRAPEHAPRVSEFLAREDAVYWLQRSGYDKP